MSSGEELIAEAESQDERLVDLAREYARLQERFFALTGRDDANEAFRWDVLSIQDDTARHEAAQVARRMRYLGRIVCSRLA